MGITVGVDTGGTFTDFIFRDQMGWRAFKVPSTPADPAEAVLSGLAEIEAGGNAIGEVVHGTTVATNAALQGRGARVAFVTTQGFRDLLNLGRQARRELYDLDQEGLPPLVARKLCFEVRERLSAAGEVLRAPGEQELHSLGQALRRAGAEAVAVCLLFSFLDPSHERRVREALAGTGLPVTISSDVLPQHREYERAVATVLNASVTPLMTGYLERLERALGSVRLRIMQSSGGCARAELAARMPIHTLLSGPAGGVVAGAWTARAMGAERLVTFDMGGTSTDVATYEGAFRVTQSATIGEWPLPVPVLDIHTVGAGGGSLAYRDAGGALAVGPQSAGADPGPAAYGRGRQPTVTDAHLALGWLDPARVAGGRVRPSEELAREAIARMARSLELDELSAAEGVARVAETHMAGALWRITAERGRDPRQFALVAFGGAGPLHAASLAATLSLGRVIVPPAPGAFSAFGMAVSDVTRHAVRGLARRGRAIGRLELERFLAELALENRRELELDASEGLDSAELSARYAGQSHELAVPYPGGPDGLDRAVASFHAEHKRLFGHADPSRPVELVAAGLRTTLARGVAEVPGPPRGSSDPSRAATGTRRIRWRGWVEATVFARERLLAGARIAGPALVTEETSTTLVPPGFTASVHPSGCLELTRT
ncbi:MAG: hydantoinase/oxoprolinase family protein [Candidatus Wallbacteria bacterium]|nr:hydantoinase/oxoprolinase family protein [Candidatus Wallbacteria bacterium]